VFGTLFLIAGGALLAIVYLLADAGRFLTATTGGVATATHALGHHLPPLGAVRTKPSGAPRAVIDLHQLLVLSVIALAIMAVISVALGWLFSGRALHRLRAITRTARTISATHLNRRLALAGPDDELKELGDTFDELLARLERSFTAQRQFVANASHELRTPLARQRTLIEVALMDPDPTVGSLQANNRRLLAAGEEQERLVEALLTLARSERGLDQLGVVDLADVVRDILGVDLRPQSGPRIHAAAGPAPVLGDRRLLERLIANLLDNAVRYNLPSGRVDIRTGIDAGVNHATLTIANTGPTIRPEDVGRLLEPFERLDGDRRASSEGAGLGLSIVRAIATAHGAAVRISARPRGGLIAEVRFPRAVTELQPVVSHSEGEPWPSGHPPPENDLETAAGRRPREARDYSGRRPASPRDRGRPRVRR
jgi:signal transduction histidine kinase